MGKKSKKAAKKGKSAPEAQRSYAGAVKTRLNSDRRPSSASQDIETYVALKPLRNHSRDLCRNNDYARGALRIIVNNVVGKGIAMQSQVKQRRGGKLDKKTNDLIEKKWKQWGKADRCHVAGRLSFAKICRLALRSMVESGEVLIRLVFDRFGGSDIPLALEIIESDQLSEDENLVQAPNGNQIRMGVEVDRWGRPQAYWLYESHPGDVHFNRGKPKPQRVPASEIIHLYDHLRPGQTRGIPWLYSGMGNLAHLGGMVEGELTNKRARANIFGVIKTLDVEQTYQSRQTQERDRSEYYMEPGIVDVLGPNEDFVGFSPSDSGQGFTPFVQLMLRGYGQGMGLSYESISNDYSNTSYSSARTSTLEQRDTFQQLQDDLIESLCDRIYPIWFEQAFLSGALQISDDYLLSPETYCCPSWTPRGWSWVDPDVEVKSSILATRACLTSLTREAAKQGVSFEEILEERRQEQELAASKGVLINLDLSQSPSSQGTEANGNNSAETQNPAGTQADSADATN